VIVMGDTNTRYTREGDNIRTRRLPSQKAQVNGTSGVVLDDRTLNPRDG
jgi:hypothetical protein